MKARSRAASAGTLLTGIVVVGIGFVTSVLLNRWFGPVGRGQLTAALIAAQLLPYLAATGLITSVLYHASPRQYGPQVTLATALPLGVVQSLLFGVSAYVLLPMFIGDETGTVLASGRLALLSLPANVAVLYLQSAFQSQLRFTLFNLLRLAIPIGTFVGVLALEVVDRLTVRNMVLLSTALPFAVLVVGMATALRLELVTGFRPRLSIARGLLKYGAKSQPGDLANSLNMRLDQLFIAAWLSHEDLGLYVAAVSATQLGGMVAFSVLTVVQPRLLHEASSEARLQLLKRALLGYSAIGVALLVSTVLLAPLAIPWLFGSAFSESVPAAQVLALAIFVLGYKTILAGAAQAYGDPWLASRAELAGAAATVGGLFILLPVLGIMGAAVTSGVAYALQVAIVAHGLLRQRRDPPVRLSDPPSQPEHGGTVAAAAPLAIGDETGAGPVGQGGGVELRELE